MKVLIKVKKILFVLDSGQRINFYKMQIALTVITFLELLGIACLYPFMGLLSDPEKIAESQAYKFFEENSGITDESAFVFIIGLLVILAIALSAVASVVSVITTTRFSNEVGAQIGSRLFNKYLCRPWLFHAENPSTKNVKKITFDVNRFTNGVLMPTVSTLPRFCFIVFMVSGLVIVNPFSTIAGAIFIIVIYIAIYLSLRKRVARNGIQQSIATQDRFKIMGNAFGGIKELMILSREKKYQDDYRRQSEIVARLNSNTQIYAQVPRYVLEFTIFSLLVSTVLYVYSRNDFSLNDIMPEFSIFLAAGVRLIPAVQQVYRNFMLVKSNFWAVESLIIDLNSNEKPQNVASSALREIPSNTKIALRNVCYRYPESKSLALDSINLDIQENKTVGIIGESGSGKSTLVDLILSLIRPLSGTLYIDGYPVNEKKVEWRRQIGYVSQTIFIADGTILENVAYGKNKSEIDREKAIEVLNVARLSKYLSRLPDGIDTEIGERGVKLSGGQRQRLGIARALYNDASVLVFDEATSALDSQTESEIMDEIYQLSGAKTIIIVAHRLDTISRCDEVYLIKDGVILDCDNLKSLRDKHNL